MLLFFLITAFGKALLTSHSKNQKSKIKNSFSLAPPDILCYIALNENLFPNKINSLFAGKLPKEKSLPYKNNRSWCRFFLDIVFGILNNQSVILGFLPIMLSQFNQREEISEKKEEVI